MENNQSFEYTYSAQQRQEIEHIRQKYLPREEDKMEKLRRLHHSATKKAQSASIAMGVIGALILGTGMSMTMTDFGAVFGSFSMIIGIIVGLAGMVLVALAWPVYNRVLKTERERNAPEILKLTDELMK